MKKLLLLLAVTLAFTFTALAQDTSQTGGATSQTTTTTKTKKSKKSSGDQMGATDQGAKPKKEATLTGCISAQPDANGNYTLSNGRYKKGVEITPSDKIKDHAGHQVELKGEWAKAGAAETAGGGTTNAAAKTKSFEVSSVKHMSDTCSQAPGGGTTGETKKGKKDTQKGKGEGATPPPSL